MAPDGVLMVIAPRPATVVIGVALVVALLANVALSIIIKRREIRRTAPVVPVLAGRVQQQRIQRATDNSLPEDLQERLRYLTGGDRAGGQDDPDPVARPAQPAAPDHTPPSPGAAASVVERFDSTHFFGDDVATAGDDRTNFFGARDEEDSTHFLGGEDGQDSTHFFGDEPTSDATSRFGDEPRSPHAPAGAQDDSTRFFGVEEDDEAEAPSGTDFFTAGDFADISIDDVAGSNGRLEALPPASFQTVARQAEDLEDGLAFDADGFQTFDDEAHLVGDVDTAPAPVASGITGALDAVRTCLATFSQPHVIAVSVLDGAGRVLAGESDADLTGELRSLMAESGLGNAANVDQAVQLQDNTVGALLLFPTGANALLGALVRDDGESDETRARLKGLAHEIGDAMRRAS